MSKQVGPIELTCDAPSYSVVRASQRAGLQSPEDVRWLRMSTFLFRPPTRPVGLTSFLRQLFRGTRNRPKTCTCGGGLPRLGAVVVAFEEDETGYILGQCPRCQTVFWEEL
jgi:hypothetical protein